MESDLAPAVERAAVTAARECGAPLVVAVSGGLDSMVLLHTLARLAPDRIAVVATFDHGTGAAARRAVQHVRRAARLRSLPLVVGHVRALLDVREGHEAAWRDARYTFLRSEAAKRGARVVTAHTEDDQVETVLMRTMRGSGARGLAGLYAESDVVRPFLTVRRTAIAAYAASHGLAWSDDPSNTSRAFLRNRIRHDLLPALRRVTPDIDLELLAVARRAATLRADVDRFVAEHLRVAVDDGRLVAGAGELAGLDDDSLRVVWGALASRVGLSLDWRGTRRIAEFTMKQPRRGWIPLSGGWTLEALRGEYRLSLRRSAVPVT